MEEPVDLTGEKNVQMDQLKENRGVSVVLCCYNSEQRIVPTLEHLAKQELLDFDVEVVLIDNASKDRTAEVAREVWDLHHSPFDLRIIHEERPGLIFARETGVLNARFDLITFCDDDNWFDPAYLHFSQELLRRESSAVAVRGKGIAAVEGEVPNWFQKYQKSYAVGELEAGEHRVGPESMFGAGFSTRKKYLLDLWNGGFEPLLVGRKGNQLLSGEDSELFYVLNEIGDLYYSDRLVFQHEINSNRLTVDYLLGVFVGKGVARPYLTLYRSMRSRGLKRLAQLPYRYWIGQLLYNVLSLGYRLFSLDSFDRQLRVAKEVQGLREVWSARTRFKQARRTAERNMNVLKQ